MEKVQDAAAEVTVKANLHQANGRMRRAVLLPGEMQLVMPANAIPAHYAHIDSTIQVTIYAKRLIYAHRCDMAIGVVIWHAEPCFLVLGNSQRIEDAAHVGANAERHWYAPLMRNLWRRAEVRSGLYSGN